jgi:hypothetical protein
MQGGNVQRYFKDCSDTQYDVLNSSNWNETILEGYVDDLTFGTAPIFTEEDYRDHVRYTSIPVESVSFGRDDRGEICKIFRRFKYTAMQIVMRWPNNVPKDVRDCIEKKQYYQKFDLVHYVGPRDIRDVSKKDIVNMPYRSVWIYPKGEDKLSESGFMSNPYSVLEFWKEPGGGMAYSPAMDVLASIKLANAEKRTIIRRAMKDVDQASMSPARFWLGRLNQNPNAMNMYDKTKYSKEDFGTIPTGGDPKLSVEMMALEQDLIDKGFFLDLFEAMTRVSKDMNNPEVNQRIAEALELIGPVVGGMTKKIGNAQIRTFDILNDRLLFPPPPKEIVNERGKIELKVIFLSPLAKAQRAAALGGLTTWLGIVKALQGIKQDAGVGVDVDRVLAGSADFLNVDPTYVMQQRKIDEIRKKTAQAQQQQAKIQQAEQMAGAAKDAASAHHEHKQAMAVK